MKTFTDSAGRTWTIAITVGSIERVRDLVSVNLSTITEPRREGGPPLLTELATDLMLLCDVIYALVKPQADQAGVTDEQFGQALGGDAIAAAHDAFWQELSDFFRSLRWTDRATAIEKQIALVRATINALDKRIETIDVARIVETVAHPADLPGVPGLLGVASSSATSSPGSPVLTPGT